MALVRIRIRRGTAAEWSSANPVLASGEPGYTTDTSVLKIGNGTDNWNTLPGITGGGGSISSVNGDTGPIVSLTEDDIPAGSTNVKYTSTEKSKLAGITAGATPNATDAFLINRANHTGSDSLDATTDSASRVAFTPTERAVLAGAVMIMDVPLGGPAVRPTNDPNRVTLVFCRDLADVPLIVTGTAGRYAKDPVFLRVTT